MIRLSAGPTASGALLSSYICRASKGELRHRLTQAVQVRLHAAFRACVATPNVTGEPCALALTPGWALCTSRTSFPFFAQRLSRRRLRATASGTRALRNQRSALYPNPARALPVRPQLRDGFPAQRVLLSVCREMLSACSRILLVTKSG